MPSLIFLNGRIEGIGLTKVDLFEPGSIISMSKCLANDRKVLYCFYLVHSLSMMIILLERARQPNEHNEQ